MLNQMEGIVLKARDYGETHKIITIFTKKLGIISAICRGANKPKSKLTAVAQNFIEANFLIYVTKGLSTVQQGQILASHRHIREDIIKTAYTAYIIELTDKILETRSPQPLLYDQLQKTLQYINTHEHYAIPVIMYELKMYQAGGFAPVVDYCVRCTRQEPPYTFSVQEGGFLCPNCSSSDIYAVQIPQAFSKILPILMHAGLERIGNISIKRENELLLRNLLDQYYDQFGGFSLKSKRFLNQIDRLQ